MVASCESPCTTGHNEPPVAYVASSGPSQPSGLPRFVASLSGGPLTCSQMIFRAVMAALEKPSVEYHQDGTRLSVLLPARRRSSSPSTELPCLLATVGATPFGQGNHKTRNLGIVVLCTALAGVRQVLLTSHRLTSRRSCIKHIRARNLHRKHRLFPREQLRYPAFKIRSEPMTVWLPPPLLSSSGQPRSLSAATNRQPLNSPR